MVEAAAETVEPAAATAAAPVADEQALAVSQESARKISGTVTESDAWIHTTKGEMFFGAWIVANSIVLALEADHQTDENENAWYWVLFDSVFNIVFAIEVVLRAMAEKQRWPLKLWNWIDFVLVVIGIVDGWILRLVDTGGGVGFLVVLRVFRLLRLARVLRVLRLLRSSKELLLLISGIEAGMRAMVWGALLLICVNFISGLLLTEIVGKDMFDGWFAQRTEGWYPDVGATLELDDPADAPEWYTENFGKLYFSMFTLFEFTMEFQGDHCKATWNDGFWLTLFFIVYTFVTNLALLQVVGSVVVEAILAISAKHHQEDQAQEKEEQMQEAKDTSEKLYCTLGEGGDLAAKPIKEEDFSSEAAKKYLSMAGLVPAQAVQLHRLLSKNGVLSKLDFTKGFLRLKDEVSPKDIYKLETRLERMKQKITEAGQQQEAMLAAAKKLAGK